VKIWIPVLDFNRRQSTFPEATARNGLDGNRQANRFGSVKQGSSINSTEEGIESDLSDVQRQKAPSGNEWKIEPASNLITSISSALGNGSLLDP
jgi:hypothetical protein